MSDFEKSHSSLANQVTFSTPGLYEDVVQCLGWHLIVKPPGLTISACMADFFSDFSGSAKCPLPFDSNIATMNRGALDFSK